MTAQEFKNVWETSDHSLRPLSIDRFKGLNLQQTTIDFLTIAGLPANVAPYLSFVRDTSDIYDGINRLTKQYDTLEKEFDKYVTIGVDGSGNLIVLNTEMNDRVEWLDHEDFSPRYMNNSINELGELLIVYRSFVDQIQQENGEDAYLDANFTDTQLETLKQKMEQVDGNALTEDGFWKVEIEMLLENRKEFFSKDQKV
ncbi:MAG: SUKH-4 family immunity protein [Bacteroidota bacterium]|nr:SUKH-4 family immunity protein [Bacteroidota bacterium]